MLTANSLTLPMLLAALPRLVAGRTALRRRLRDELARLFGVDARRIVLTDTGRAALALLLRAHGVGAGDEVIVPAYTCVVVPNQIPALGATIRWLDVSAATLGFDWNRLDAAIGPATRAVIVPHNFGPACRVPDALCLRHPRVVFLDDAAHGFASQCDGQWLGTYHDGAFFSFEYSKNLSGGIGGFALLPEGLAVEEPPAELGALDQLRLLATLTGHLLAARCALAGRVWLALARRVGLIYRSSDAEVADGVAHPPRALPTLSAALLLPQLAALPALLRHKQRLAEHYRAALSAVPGLTLWPGAPGAHWVRYPFALPQPVADKAALARRLSAACGLAIGVWFDDVIHPAGSFRHGYLAGSAPEGERLAATVLNLPMNIAIACDAALDARLARLAVALAAYLKETAA
nr:DegT/DnrJ/EryC1/StrS family aminotransferase [uncultured Pseudogulbenkiania sp.]